MLKIFESNFASELKIVRCPILKVRNELKSSENKVKDKSSPGTVGLAISVIYCAGYRGQNSGF